MIVSTSLAKVGHRQAPLYENPRNLWLWGFFVGAWKNACGAGGERIIRAFNMLEHGDE